MKMNKIGKLIKAKTISFIEELIKHYREIGLNEIEAMILCKLYYLMDERKELSITNISKEMSLDEDNLANKLVELEKLGYLEIYEKDFSLDHTMDKLGEVLAQDDINPEDRKYVTGQIVSFVEASFNRNLNANDLVLINQWLDEKYDLDTIKSAILKTMNKGVTNLKYTDAILNSVKKVDNEEVEDEELKNLINSIYGK